MRSIRVMPPVYLVTAAAVMAVLNVLVPLAHLFNWPWRWLGLVPMIGGQMFGLWAVWMFKKHQTTIRPGRTSNQLVTGGPFRFSRNPIYLGMVLELAGAAILFGSLSPWLVIPLFVLVLSRWIIPVEEAMLLEKFPAEYSAYRTHVRRWI